MLGRNNFSDGLLQFLGHCLIFTAMLMFFNAGFSMLQYRRMAIQFSDSKVKAPLDVQIEIFSGLVLSFCGAIALYRPTFEKISLIHSYQRKTPEQVFQGRRSFRNVMQTRGQMISKASKIKPLSEVVKTHPNLLKLMAT